MAKYECKCNFNDIQSYVTKISIALYHWPCLNSVEEREHCFCPAPCESEAQKIDWLGF
jgi:hypothetical protein